MQCKCIIVATRTSPVERIERMASASAVVIFSVSTCCMCHAAKSLFRRLGVSPTAHEIDRDPRRKEMERALLRMLQSNYTAVPAVFVGGKLVGSMECPAVAYQRLARAASQRALEFL